MELLQQPPFTSSCGGSLRLRGRRDGLTSAAVRRSNANFQGSSQSRRSQTNDLTSGGLFDAERNYVGRLFRNIIMSTVEVHPQSPATRRKPVRCWALCRNKQRCKTTVNSREGEAIPIPYCNQHLRCGDYALRVVEHPFAGKCIVARFDLPPKYRMAFHGIRGKCPPCNKDDRSISFYPPNPKTGTNYYPNTRTLRSDNYNGVLNPKHTGDILQYAANPGKNERQNCRSTFRYWGKRNGSLGGLEFVTLETIPKNTLLMHWYGRGWWSARDMRPSDVGTDKYPAPKRRKLGKTHSMLIQNKGISG